MVTGYPQVQRSAVGTPSSASSVCWPQPAQVVLPQDAQRAGEHMESPSDE